MLWGLTSSSSEPTEASPSAGRLAVTVEASAEALAGLPVDVFDSSELLDASRSIRGKIPDKGNENIGVY